MISTYCGGKSEMEKKMPDIKYSGFKIRDNIFLDSGYKAPDTINTRPKEKAVMINNNRE